MTNSLISKLKRFSLFPLAIILVLSSSVFIDQKAHADTHDDKVRAWILYIGQDGDSNSTDPGCFDGIDKISYKDVSGNSLGGSGFSRERTVQNKKMSCTDIYNEGIPKWGFSSAEDFLTAAEYKKNDGKNQWEPTNGRQAGANRAIRKKLGIQGDDPSSYLSPGELYSYYYSDFVSTCSVTDEKNRTEFNSSQTTLADKAADGYISYSKIGKDGNNDTVQQVIAKYKGPNKKVQRDRGGTKDEEDKQTCIDKSKKVTEQAQAAVKEAEKNKANTGGNADAGTGEQPAQTAGGSEDKEEESKSRCAIDGVGWFICPVVNLLADISDDSADILVKLLEVNSIILTDRGPDSAFYYWSRIRDIANIVFIIVFLIIIYSQVSGLGISNYGIKKLLPKLLMTIILVNISFYICSILVDISNIIGSSSFNFITSLGGGGSGPEGGWATKGNWWTGAAATILGTATAFFVLGSLISGLVFVVVTATVTVFLLGARQALVIFTIILSPLAFVALLLPSTEGLFKKWWGFFKTLLFLYPAIGLLYGACNLGATVINGMKGDSEVLLQIIAAALTFTPLLLVSRLTSLMTSMMGLANIADKWGNLAGKATEKKLQSGLDKSVYGRFMAERERAKELAHAQTQAGTYKGWNPVRRLQSGAMRGINKHARKLPGSAGRSVRRAQNYASRLVDQQAEEEMKLSESFFENYRYLDKDGKEQALSRNDIFTLAMGGKIQGYKKNKDGSIEKGDVIDAKSFSAFDRRYIVTDAAKNANSNQLRALSKHVNDNLGSGDRAVVADALSRSPAAAKNPWWTGKAADQLRAGKFNYEQAVVEGALGGKYNAPKMADMDEPAFKDMMEVLNSDSISGISEDQLMEARQATGLAIDAALQSQLYNAKMQSNEAIYRRASRAREWSQDPTKHFRVMSDNAKRD
ncbi:MAG: hypothetical protein Q4B27_00480 [Candidatus Saccharibacteria bacterium]|nr:hypothetical protein [Candidatus Saccharibacteria bacterium]